MKFILDSGLKWNILKVSIKRLLHSTASHFLALSGERMQSVLYFKNQLGMWFVLKSKTPHSLFYICIFSHVIAFLACVKWLHKLCSYLIPNSAQYFVIIHLEVLVFLLVLPQLLLRTVKASLHNFFLYLIFFMGICQNTGLKRGSVLLQLQFILF